MIAERLGWKPTRPLREGMEKTYAWIFEQVMSARAQEMTAKK
jgi:nucleoside-diphosphate-sugar epimerase